MDPPTKMHHKIEFILLTIFNILDILTTIYFLEFTPLMEGNPLGIFLIEKFGYLGIVVPKLILLIMLGYYLLGEDVKNSRIAKYEIRLIVLLYFGVVLYNIAGIALFYIG